MFVERLLIIDGHAYAYRAFYAIRVLRSPEGRPTNAIYGFIKMLEKMVASLRPDFLAVVWDGGLSAERVALMPHYKAQRPETPEELKPQFDEIVNYLKAAGMMSLCKEGIEADDYIASLAKLAEAAGVKVVIASSDKDFMQLVSPAVGLFNPNDKTEMVWTNVQVREKIGVEPEQVVDWLSLVGDTVDNIHGVPGVGRKTATGLLGKFGSIKNMYARLAEVKPERLRFALAGAVEMVQHNIEMVRLRDNLPCAFLRADYRMKPPEVGKLKNLYSNWGFKGLLTALEASAQDRQQLLI